ncbi:hypothetical protein QBC40DRAFT_320895 [Triangularia verruculosa]|uniref:Uncharacterized protein n=1 Tax=Triangularia verruculosa TaxID=2587418 RepID=A0AAN6X7C8_9PEZI|nr:hypothetical protein QBC40DRAFT_320895 [Triangularia verruculosa]
MGDTVSRPIRENPDSISDESRPRRPRDQEIPHSQAESEGQSEPDPIVLPPLIIDDTRPRRPRDEEIPDSQEESQSEPDPVQWQNLGIDYTIPPQPRESQIPENEAESCIVVGGDDAPIAPITIVATPLRTNRRQLRLLHRGSIPDVEHRDAFRTIMMNIKSRRGQLGAQFQDIEVRSWVVPFGDEGFSLCDLHLRPDAFGIHAVDKIIGTAN